MTIINRNRHIQRSGNGCDEIDYVLDHYMDDPDGSFTSLRNIVVSTPEVCKDRFFHRLAKSNRFIKPEHLFTLLHLCGPDCFSVRKGEEIVLKYCECTKQIVELLYYWLDNDLHGCIPSVPQFVRNLAKVNPRIIREYIRVYRKRHRNSQGAGVSPLFFEDMAYANPLTAIQSLDLFDFSDDIERNMILEMSRMILGCCHSDPARLPEMQALYVQIRKIGRCPSQFKPSKEDEILSSPVLDDRRYGYFVNAIDSMIAQLECVPEPFKPEVVKDVLRGFSTLTRVLMPIIEDAQKTNTNSGLPILNKLMSASLPDSDITALERSLARSILEIFEQGSSIFCTKPRGSYSTKDRREHDLRSLFKDRGRDETLLPEMLLYIRLESTITRIEPEYGGRGNSDLEILLGDAHVIIENISPLPDQKVRLSNEGHLLTKSRVQYAIGEKVLHLERSGAFDEVRANDNVYAIIAINTTALPIRWIDEGLAIRNLTPPDHSDPEKVRRHLESIFNQVPNPDAITKICEKIQNVSAFVCYNLLSIEGGVFTIWAKVYHNPLADKRLPPELEEELTRLLMNQTMA